MDLLTDFITKHIFLHDDWNPDNGFPDWDCYDTNPFLLSADTCVVGTLEGYGEKYLDYLRSNALLPPTLVIPQANSKDFMTLTQRLASDKSALNQLKLTLANGKSGLSVFYRYDENSHTTIERTLSTGAEGFQIRPNYDSFFRSDNRVLCWQQLKQLGFPLPLHKICNNTSDVMKFAYEAFEQGFIKIILKLRHRNLIILNNFELHTLHLIKLSFPLITEAVYPVLFSPVSQAIRWKGQTQYLFTVAQQIIDFDFAGNRSLPNQWKFLEKKCAELLASIHNVFPSHEGVFGVDFIFTESNQLLVVDVNPRFNSSTYPFYFLNSRNRSGQNRIGYYGVTDSYLISNLSDLYVKLGEYAYNSLTHKGILLFNPVIDRNTSKLKKWSYFSISESESEETIFLDLIASISEEK